MKRNTKLWNCTLTLSVLTWRVSWGDADSEKRHSAPYAPQINMHKQKDKTKSTVYQQICIILFSLLYSQFSTIPHCNPLRGKEKRPREVRGGGVRGCRFPDILKKTLPISPVRKFRPAFQPNIWALCVFSSCFLLVQRWFPVFVKMSVLVAQTNNTKVRVNTL